MKDRGTAAYQLFLLALSVYVLTVLVLESFVIEDNEIKRVLQIVDFAVCMVFLADFFVNVATASNRRDYLQWGWLDLVSSIPAIDPLRWGRLSRVVRILRFLRSIKSARLLVSAVNNSRLESLTLVFLLVVFLTFTLSSALILEFERPHESSINSAETALWWCAMNLLNAKVSITEATSAGGVAITVVLNKLGLLLFAYVNAVLIAWLLQKRKPTDEAR